jgi:hypothetical protein
MGKCGAIIPYIIIVKLATLRTPKSHYKVGFATHHLIYDHLQYIHFMISTVEILINFISNKVSMLSSHWHD